MHLRELLLFTIPLLNLFSLQCWAQEAWEKKSWREWTAKDCARILESSAWVRRDASLLSPIPLAGQPNDTGSPSGGPESGGRGKTPVGQRSPGRPNMVYYRWYSSLVIRQAIVRSLQLSSAIDEAQSRQFLENPAFQKSYAISVSAESPQPLMRLFASHEEAIRTASYLEKKNGQKIGMERIIPMDPKRGAMDLILVFPRRIGEQPTLAAEDREVELVLVVGDRKLRQKFRLDRMLVAGKLDL